MKVELDGRSTGEAILATAQSLGCDLLIKGAYTQSRLRQMDIRRGDPTRLGKSVSSNVQHAGRYSAYVVGPSSGTSSGVITSFQQTFNSIPTPFQFTAYLYTTQPPTAGCSHPYNQFSIYDDSGHTFEGGFAATGNGYTVFSSSESEQTNYLQTAYSLNQWHRFDVSMNSNGFSYYVDSALIRVNQNSYMFSNIKSVQFLASCSGAMYVDDVSISPTSSRGVQYSTQIPNCPYLTAPERNDGGAQFSDQCMFIPIYQNGDTHFSHHDLTYQVTFTDSAPQLAGVLNNGAWSPLSWDMVPNAPTLETNINQIIQNGFNEWSNAFAAYGSPSLFTFRQVNALPADIHFYVVRIQETSTGRIVHEAGYYEFMESQTPYVAGIVLTVPAQPNALNAHVVHEVSHAFGLGHFCSVNPWNNPAPRCYIPNGPNDLMSYTDTGGRGISNFDVQIIVDSYKLWDSGGTFQAQYGATYGSTPLYAVTTQSNWKILMLSEAVPSMCPNPNYQHDQYTCLLDPTDSQT